MPSVRGRLSEATRPWSSQLVSAQIHHSCTRRSLVGSRSTRRSKRRVVGGLGITIRVALALRSVKTVSIRLTGNVLIILLDRAPCCGLGGLMASLRILHVVVLGS